ncbi:hypothetical protein NDN08_004643 [Rhodosorus marinus]|uniref:Gluconokinase n=1 Tax=Rhodosorus marinus TaxID=101924 RepID=A0AAV8UPL8_9RHOD|nr:hypothetical protein NDN08_004643 [Rhodosorus marinus]
MKYVIVLMGVSSCGKTSIGLALSKQTHRPFVDGDDLHPAENIEKMRSGVPLNDDDRFPWLLKVASAANERDAEEGLTGIIACSCLKRIYRDFLRRQVQYPVVFVHLDGSFEKVRERMEARSGHFMPVHLLRDQFSQLERPEASQAPWFSIQTWEDPSMIISCDQLSESEVVEQILSGTVEITKMNGLHRR